MNEIILIYLAVIAFTILAIEIVTVVVMEKREKNQRTDAQKTYNRENTTVYNIDVKIIEEPGEIKIKLSNEPEEREEHGRHQRLR